MRVRPRLIGPLLAATLLVGAAAAPCVLACSCAEPLPLAESVDARTAVVVGRVGVPVGGRYPFAVERWFTGPAPMAVLTVEGAEMRLADGQVVVNTCGRAFQPGQHLVLVGGQEGPMLQTSICSHGADVGSPEGQALIAEAERLFGPGTRPDPAPGPATEGSGDEGVSQLLPVVLVGAAAVGLGAIVLAAVVLLARRREV